MIRLIRYLPFILILFSLGCSTGYWSARHERMEQCRNLWEYVELKDTLKIKVLYFQAQSTPHTGIQCCNFIIGTSEKLGKIGIADYSYTGKIKIGDIVEVLPSNWNEDDKQYVHILFRISKNQKINDLHCSLYTIFYGKISNIVEEKH